MTKAELQRELTDYAVKLETLEGELRAKHDEARQVLANANAVKGVCQYLQSKLYEMKDEPNGDAGIDHPDAGAESVDRIDGEILD